MDTALHIQHLRTDSAALLAAWRADPSAAVPSCPGWDRTQLLAHTSGAHGWVRAQLRVGSGERIRMSTVERAPEGDLLPGWYEEGAAELVALLEAMDVGATWPTWAGPQPGTFFARRMAHETAVHLWDAEPRPIDTDLAVDGVDELLEVFAPRLPGDRFGGMSGTIHLHATDEGLDGAGEWLVGLGPEGITFDKGHAKGDVALRGAASDLLLWAWNRVPVDDRFEVHGDDALLHLWTESVTI